MDRNRLVGLVLLALYLAAIAWMGYRGFAWWVVLPSALLLVGIVLLLRPQLLQGPRRFWSPRLLLPVYVGCVALSGLMLGIGHALDWL